ncbi:hypothetical protein Cpir12675_003505 [Ceratocystis pirilliformis]|uniref:Pyridoxamine 5'-phosphate oxidase N-terminal domain-containing protein n=1 Tax=Ceratocystis pirilliformis TaxID=259994 RepID=A0ABR3Z443_9PEZI
MAQNPLNSEASLGENNLVQTTSLPHDVVQCLENARFLHLATCNNNQPHVSLMNYTYLPSSPYSQLPVIVMTSNPESKKVHNIIENPNVSLLVHDWVSHRPPTSSRRLSGGSPTPESRSSLATLLANLNSSAMSSISATINGSARMLKPGSPEEEFYRSKHLENNTFTENGLSFNNDHDSDNRAEDGGRECFVAGEEVNVLLVDIKDVRVSDWKGSIRDVEVVAMNGNNAAGMHS